MTIEEVAARAGAGKATIYRRSPTKGAFAMDAVMAEIDPAAPFPDTGSAVQDFRVQRRAVARGFNRPRISHTLTGVVFEAQNELAPTTSSSPAQAGRHAGSRAQFYGTDWGWGVRARSRRTAGTVVRVGQVLSERRSGDPSRV